MIRFGTSITVTESSQVAAARRAVMQCAEGLRFGETTAGHAALVTTELATNLVKHGGGGSILAGSDDESPETLLVAAIDRGPGISNVGAAMRDGFSTAGSPGTGLGAIARAAQSTDLYSFPDRGTALVCRIAEAERIQHAPPVAAASLAVAGICIAKSGESEPGDSWVAMRNGGDLTLMVADGLGHGPAAATASIAAVNALRANAEAPLDQLMQSAHGLLRPTRGAAVMIARILLGIGRLDAVGIGNIAGAVVDDDKARRIISHNGIVGHEMRKVQPVSLPWSGGSILILASDGLGTSWNLDAYPGLAARDPAMIAAVLYRDYCRGSDDATVVVVKAP